MMKKVLFLGCVILMQSLFGYSQDSKTRGFYSILIIRALIRKALFILILHVRKYTRIVPIGRRKRWWLLI